MSRLRSVCWWLCIPRTGSCDLGLDGSTERDGAQITVLWYSGSYTGSWKPGATSDTIPLDSAIHWDFELTRRGQKLHKCVRVALISKYSELDD